jgi:membrane protein YdbS with pleckstrin-like domain
MSSALRWKLFASLAVSINLIAFLMVRLAPRPAVGVGAALDVAVTVPLLYVLLVVRGGLQPVISLAPLMLPGLLRATYLAPGISWARPAIGAGAELALFAFIAVRLRRGWRAGANDEDVLSRIETAAREIVPARRAAAILASEIAVFYYAFCSWRTSPDTPARSRAFSIHEQSGVAALFGMLAGVSVMEALLVHLAVTRWSVTAAWVLTALSLYGMMWLAALARSFILRPVLVRDGELIARSGMMWTVRIPLAAIHAIDSNAGPYELKLPPAAEPNLVLRLTAPVTARGMYGRKRRISSLALAIDDPSGLTRALHHEI